MAHITLYSKANCAYCERAKQFLDSKKWGYHEIRVDLDPEKHIEMEKLSGKRSVPQIFINDKSIGGYDDLVALAKSGDLDNLMK